MTLIAYIHHGIKEVNKMKREKNIQYRINLMKTEKVSETLVKVNRAGL